MKEENVVKVVADLGNSNLKMYVGETFFFQPTMVKFHYKKPVVQKKSLDTTIDTLHDNLHFQIHSNALDLSGIYSAGMAALKQHDCQNMNIEEGETKDQSDIPFILLPVYTAVNQLQDYYKEKNKLPELLKINVELCTALPASQFHNKNVKNLKNKLVSNRHLVTLFINDELVQAHVTFTKVEVTSEGVPPMILLATTKNKEIFNDYKKLYQKDFDISKFQKVKSVHSDIGEGTHELIVSEGLDPLFTECSGTRRGVGHAVQKAIELYSDEKGIELTRQEFINILQGDSIKKKTISSLLERTKIEEASKILGEIKRKCLRNNPELLVVYGGGSIVFKKHLYQKLVDFCADTEMELLWIPEEYAINMNINGLKIML